MNEELAVSTIAKTELVPSCPDIEVTATQPGEMLPAQHALIDWCVRKCAALEKEKAELDEAHAHAVAHKWKSSTLKAHSIRIGKRIQYYTKIRAALEAGYCIVPNFPVSLFAIRTEKGSPLKLMSNYRHSNFQQQAEGAPIGEGEYKNPMPVVFQRTIQKAEPGKKEEIQYWAEDFQAVDFPIQMAKPRIMEATTRAMALNIFDEFGILPAARNKDPLIVGRVKLGGSPKWDRDGNRVTFIIAWNLNTNVL